MRVGCKNGVAQPRRNLRSSWGDAAFFKVPSVMVAASALLVVSAASFAQAAPELSHPAAATPVSCDPQGGLSFVCGVKNPEDMVLVPGTRWLVTGGVAIGGGLRLVDTDAKTAKLLYVGGTRQVDANPKLYPGCASAPDPASFVAHGLSLRPAGAQSRYRLYVVSHGKSESIQVFALDARGAEPTLSWTGCVPLPEGVSGNAVTAFSDGTILATVRGKIDHPVASIAGITGGAIAAWKPGDTAFHQLAGTEMSGPNGIEGSLDDKEFYVASSGTQTVFVFSRADPSKPLRQARAPLTSLDNLRWTDGHLIAAGMIADEPACGGTRQRIVAHGGDAHACNRGYAAVELDPASMEWRVVAYAEPNPAFGGVATAIPVGRTLWLSSYTMDRVAYRPLPGAK